MKSRDPADAVNSAAKSTHKTGLPEKAPTRHAQKAPTRREGKAPTYYCTSLLLGVVGVVELRDLLLTHQQHEWTGARMFGLLLLLSLICKHGTQPFPLPADLADQYVTPIKRRKSPDTIQEPLAVLCRIGIIEKDSDAVVSYVTVSAKYRLSARYAGRIQKFDVPLPPKMSSKLEQAEPRRESRLNRKYPFRRSLLADLALVGLSPEARGKIAELLRLNRGGGGLKGIIGAIDERRHTVTVNQLGTIRTSLSDLPRELKPHLTIDGEAAVCCDTSHAHHCFLPRLIADRIAWKHREHPNCDLQYLEAERARLIERLSGPDYYGSWCKEPTDREERERKKALINRLLNMPNSECTGNGFYQWIRRTFPLTYGIIEDIKRDDHRNLSKQLQRFTSNAINGALTQLQSEGIIAIPQTDAILCRQRDQDRVRLVIGAWVFRESTGVRCKVNGAHVTPP